MIFYFFIFFDGHPSRLMRHNPGEKQRRLVTCDKRPTGRERRKKKKLPSVALSGAGNAIPVTALHLQSATTILFRQRQSWDFKGASGPPNKRTCARRNACTRQIRTFQPRS